MASIYQKQNGKFVKVAVAEQPPIASTTTLGVAKPDGVSIVIDEDGVLHAVAKWDPDKGALAG